MKFMRVFCFFMLFTAVKTKKQFKARTLFYEDAQIFVILQLYFPFSTPNWSYGIPFTAINSQTYGHHREASSGDNIITNTSDVMTNSSVLTTADQSKTANETNFFELLNSTNNENNQLHPFAKRIGQLPRKVQNNSYPLPYAMSFWNETTLVVKIHQKAHSRQKRTLFVRDTTANLAFCLTVPFSVPILAYDQSVLSSYKTKAARDQFEDFLPYLPLFDDEFVDRPSTFGLRSLDDNVYPKKNSTSTFGSRPFGSSLNRSTSTLVNDKRQMKTSLKTSFVSWDGKFPYGEAQEWFPAKIVGLTPSNRTILNTASQLPHPMNLEHIPMVSMASEPLKIIQKSSSAQCRKYRVCLLAETMLKSSVFEMLFLSLFHDSIPIFAEEPDAVNIALNGGECNQKFKIC